MHYLFMRLRRTQQFIEWYESQRPKDRAQIAKRLANIELHGHFGLVRKLDEFLTELKWANGRRVYFSLIEDNQGDVILLLLGGNKNGQDADIKQAQKILKANIEH